MSFSFYRVGQEYCDYLRRTDHNVPHTMESKANRPFVGIVFKIGAFNYYAPLTSPKKKHMKMKNQLDFMKINEGRWGAVNFNNMIPVPEDCLEKVDFKINDNDTYEERAYKNLLANQLSWCNAHKGAILKNAGKLYELVTEGRAWSGLKERCCDFRADEKRCLEYTGK